MKRLSRSRAQATPDAVLWKTILGCAVIIATGLFVYGPSVHGPFAGDDVLYLTNNTLLHDPARIWKAWFAPGSFIEYYPIEQTLQYFQWQAWGESTFGYHVTNVVLHLMSALLVWRLFARLHLKLAWLGALFFAIHPMQVESVASISEFKDTLSLPPFLMALTAWVDYSEKRARRDYYLTLGLFIIAMLCKASVAPFPVVLLLYAWWKDGRVTGAQVRESAPFFAVSLVLTLLTLYSGYTYLHHSQSSSFESVAIGPFLSHLALVGTSALVYLAIFFWPARPLLYYPLWSVNPPAWWHLLPWLVFVFIAAVLWIERETWGRHVIFALGFFFLFLAPFLGFFAISYMQFTWVMDHFLYIPMIGLIGLLMAALGQIYRQLSPMLKTSSLIGTCAIVALLAWRSFRYTGIFSDEEALFNYLFIYNPQSWIAREQYGQYLLEHNRPSEAIPQLAQSLRINPACSTSHYLLALAFVQEDRMTEADQEFKAAVGLLPRFAVYYDGYGAALEKKGHLADAIPYFKKALELAPGSAMAHNNLAGTLYESGDIPQAIDEWQQALKLDPGLVPAHINLAIALLRVNRTADAISEFQEALRLDPTNASVKAELEALFMR